MEATLKILKEGLSFIITFKVYHTYVTARLVRLTILEASFRAQTDTSICYC